MVFSEVPQTSKVRRQKIREFLQSVSLEMSEDVETFVVAKEEDRIVACGGLSGKVLKNIAIDESIRGEGAALSLMSELLKVAYREGRFELFLFTKPHYQEVFESCGFKYIEQAHGEVILMENSYAIEAYKKRLRKLRHSGDTVGCIVMNANPFTLGHRYLVQEACARSDWVHLFVVKEDASFFRFADRYRMIEEGVRDFSNLTLHEGSDYMISKATFPTYFIKDKGRIDSLYTELDLAIFRHHLAPPLGITHRFVGEEPLCVVTNEYNTQMKRRLAEASEYPPIELVELKRIAESGEPISASRVRGAMKENRWDEIARLVPQSTYRLLAAMKEEVE